MELSDNTRHEIGPPVFMMRSRLRKEFGNWAPICPVPVRHFPGRQSERPML